MLKRVFIQKINTLIQETKSLEKRFNKKRNTKEKKGFDEYQLLLKEYGRWKKNLKYYYESYFSKEKASKYYADIISNEVHYKTIYDIESYNLYTLSLKALREALDNFLKQINDNVISKTDVKLIDILKSILASMALPAIAYILLQLSPLDIPLVNMIINVLVFFFIGMLISFPSLNDNLEKWSKTAYQIMSILNLLFLLYNLIFLKNIS